VKYRTWKRRATRLIADCKKILRRRRDWHWQHGADHALLRIDVSEQLRELATKTGRHEHTARMIRDGYLPEAP
jgi:hypothetical protein